MIKHLKVLAFALGGGALLALPLLAADVNAEITTAATHAGLAAKATDIDTMHKHLHHAANCLVGPNGTGFDKAELNPCAKSGDGAIPDTTDAAKQKSLKAALAKVNAGIATTDMAKAKADAEAAAADLKKIS